MTSSGTAITGRIVVLVFAFLWISLLSSCAAFYLSTSGKNENARTLTMVAAGDTSGYRAMPTESELKSVRELISGRDIFIFNAEGVFSKKLHLEDCHRFRNQSLFMGSLEVIDNLPRGDITVASLANNHALDCGREGILETMQEFKKRGILTVGAGGNLREACNPVMLVIKGLHVAVLSYLEIDPVVQDYIGMDPDWFSGGTNRRSVASWKLCNGQKQIEAIRKEADIVLVFVHMHNTIHSWSETPDEPSVSLVKNILDAGADVVLGSGSHFPQGIMRHDRNVALLSLGNFLLQPDYNMPEKGHRSMLADFAISHERISLALVPLRLDIRGIPRIALQEDAGIILNRLVFLSDQLGTALEIRKERGYMEMQRIPINSLLKPNIYNSGQ